VGGGPFGFGVDSVATSYAILMWTFDELMPGRAASGVITGKVLRASYDASTGESRYDPIPGTLVTGVNGAGYSLLEDPAAQNVSSAFTQSDGTFTLFDARYTGGLIGVSARTPDGQSKVATAFEGNPMDAANYNLRFFRNIAQVTITFEPMTPGPGPTAVDVEVMRKGADGERLATDGLIVEGSRLLVGIRKKNAVVEQVQIGGQAVPFGSDPLPVGDPARFDLVTTEDFVASPPGTYRVEVSARGEDDVVRTVIRSFRVVAEGTGNDTPDPDARPVVLEAQTFPKAGSTHSTVAVLPQIEFSEPVRNLPGHVRLFERDESGTETPVTVRLLGVTPGSATVTDVSSPGQAATPVLSLMVEPMPGPPLRTFVPLGAHGGHRRSRQSVHERVQAARRLHARVQHLGPAAGHHQRQLPVTERGGPGRLGLPGREPDALREPQGVRRADPEPARARALRGPAHRQPSGGHGGAAGPGDRRDLGHQSLRPLEHPRLRRLAAGRPAVGRGGQREQRRARRAPDAPAPPRQQPLRAALPQGRPGRGPAPGGGQLRGHGRAGHGGMDPDVDGHEHGRPGIRPGRRGGDDPAPGVGPAGGGGALLAPARHRRG
jgi:hypothetical protein